MHKILPSVCFNLLICKVNNDIEQYFSIFVRYLQTKILNSSVDVVEIENLKNI